MATRAERKAVVALHRKKGRKAAGQFVVEGIKSVEDLLASGWAVESLFVRDQYCLPDSIHVPSSLPLVEVTESEMQEMSTLESPQPVLAVVQTPPETDKDLTCGRWLVLDGVRDPGNMGTVIRLADWFALEGVIVSPDCVDWTSPKVVQASMGSLFRVPLCSRDLSDLLQEDHGWAAGAFLNGESVYDTDLPADGWLVLGNEAHGIRPGVEALLPQRLTIPRFGQADSLNVAMSAAVLCSEWRRS